MTEDAAVSIEGLRVQFGKQAVLPQLSISIPKGQIVGLIGPSGSGKSTLVKTVIGLNRFQAGTVTVFGKSVPSLAAMSDIGYMAQNDALYEDLSAWDNLLFFGSICGTRGQELKDRAEELLDFVDLGGDRKKAVRNFSGGMKRRLSLAIALVNRPKLLILDEPTVGIDPVLRRKFWDGFESLKAKGCTLLVTTHVMDETARCDRILLLREGKILANGTLKELLAQTHTANIEDAFLRFSGVDVEESEAE